MSRHQARPDAWPTMPLPAVPWMPGRPTAWPVIDHDHGRHLRHAVRPPETEPAFLAAVLRGLRRL